MMLPEEYVSKCLQIATEALKKIASPPVPAPQWTPDGALQFSRKIAQQALNEMRRLP